MDYQLEEIITVFDKVFARIGQKSLVENAEFTVDSQSIAPFFMRFYSMPKSGRVEMIFELTPHGATFWIDKTQEIPDVSYNMIKENTVRFEGLIGMIFTSLIHTEYKGQRTTLSFINSIDNVMIGQFKFQSGLWPNWFSPKTTKIFEPYFEV